MAAKENLDNTSLLRYFRCDLRALRFSNKSTMPIKFINGVKKVVEYSFIVQKSITHLDLSLGEFSSFKRKLQTENYMFTSNSSSTTAAEENVVITEEGVRKHLAPDRKLLYNLHLDMSKGLELSLRNSNCQEILPRFSSTVIINKIVCHTTTFEAKFHRKNLKDFWMTNQKVKFINLVSKSATCLKVTPNYCPQNVKFFNVLYSQRADSTVVVDFLINNDFRNGEIFCLIVDVFEYVLCQASHARFNLWQFHHKDMINASIKFSNFVKTETLLQYRDASRFCINVYEDLISSTKRFDTLKKGPECPVKNGLITKERHFLILQIFDVFRNNRLSGLKALQMLWRSIPDSFISMDDLNSTFSEQKFSSFQEELCDFITDITGDLLKERRQPRTLKHKCRTVIRRVLSDNFRLSTGIDELNLPPSVAIFLRLGH